MVNPKSIAQRVVDRHVSETRVATSQEQWEMAAEILDKGEDHPALKVVKAAFEEVVKEIGEAAKRSANLKRVGVGRTEDPTLVVAHVVPALKELGDVAHTVAKQLEQRLK